VVANGKEVIAKVLQQKPRIVAFDNTVPLKDALECIREIRQIAPTIKIVLVSMRGGRNLE
jgi:DNA-binding NarL/FixJ family response regulator